MKCDKQKYRIWDKNIKKMTKLDLAAFFPLMAVLIGSFRTMILSFNSGENWRIICAATGFLIFCSMTLLFVIVMYRKVKTEKKK